MTDRLDRRTVLRVTGATMAAATVAGCTGGGSTETDSEEPTETPTPTDSTGGDDGGDGGGDDGSEDAPSFDGWMNGVGNYDGVVDETGSDSVTVTVGAEGNGGAFGFQPAAVRVSPGTTVTWEWTGEGGSHNVVADDGSYESELTDEQGFTFERTFEEASESKYFCQPHKTMGMKGVVVVE